MADGTTTVSFVRRAKHLVALYGEDVVPVTLLCLKADLLTSGHRFHTHELISLRSADGYEDQMMTEAKVMPSFAKRREKIVHDVVEGARDIGGEAIMPADLIDEVTSLAEWPVIYQSSLDEEFLKVPQECSLFTSHQNTKDFVVQD